MNPLGLECLSVFGLDPVSFIRLAGDLGCQYVTLNLSPAANRLPIYPEVSFRRDPALRREMAAALRDYGVRVGLIEGFVIAPEAAGDHQADLDLAAELDAKAICAISLERDAGRMHDAFARLAEMAAARGLITTTEVGAGVLWRFAKALAVVEAVAHPSFKLLIDTMHFFRGGASVADLERIDRALIGHVQLCDVPMPAVIASYMEEALYERRAPGDGDLPLADFLRAVPEHVIVGLEIPIRSEAEAGIGPHARLGRCLSQARALLARVASLDGQLPGQA